MLGTLGPAYDRNGAARGQVSVAFPLLGAGVAARLSAMEQTVEQQLVQAATDEMRVPFWVVLAGVGVGAFWALAGVLIGTRIARRH